ncbi:hypothetical protein AMV137 [Betaentomopoxvirus amoorei]|uniref:AMV137 n=1 Tax=Amsacta moorei entomopoxvirus TaxID=28321 RepID=Q9EMR2_AMEPV|nr:hypothetical protein AMV137 [Amsacta moorei entomopoxvirus]AAG02843.1 AMV137 [Amsacta moorei entomopoxvirus]
MIFIYILLFFLIIFIFMYIIVIIYYYNISYLPEFIPDQIIRQNEGLADISHFIRIREDINRYILDINTLDANIINIKQEINRLENTIEIQQLTIRTLRDELRKIEEAIDDQINLEIGQVDLPSILMPLYILLETDTYIKYYIYKNVLQFTYKFIYLTQLNIRKNTNVTKTTLLLNNLNLTNIYVNKINTYMYDKISIDIYKFIQLLNLYNSIRNV